jgi:beta-galactosidase
VIRTKDGQQFHCTFWSDVIHLQNAESLANYEQDYYAGSPAITHNKFGKGTAFYVGTVLDQSAMNWLVEHVCKSVDLQPVAANMPAGVELLQRTIGKSSFLFVLNHSNEKVIVPVGGNGRNLLTSADINGPIELDPSGVAVIQME